MAAIFLHKEVKGYIFPRQKPASVEGRTIILSLLGNSAANVTYGGFVHSAVGSAGPLPPHEGKC